MAFFSFFFHAPFVITCNSKHGTKKQIQMMFVYVVRTVPNVRVPKWCWGPLLRLSFLHWIELRREKISRIWCVCEKITMLFIGCLLWMFLVSSVANKKITIPSSISAMVVVVEQNYDFITLGMQDRPQNNFLVYFVWQNMRNKLNTEWHTEREKENV